MKITVNIDCTPEEARGFLGLPDVTPLQEAFVEALGKHLDKAVDGIDGEALFKAWMPDGMAGWEQWREMWSSGGGKTTK